jgi:hypothetical protein
MSKARLRAVAMSSAAVLLALAMSQDIATFQQRPQDSPLAAVVTSCRAPSYLPPPNPDRVALLWSASKRYQLVIGADQYAMSPEHDRPFVGLTTRFVSARLTERGFAPLPSFATASEPFLSGSTATKARIWDAIREMRRKTLGNDVGVIYYVGHGSVAPNQHDLSLATQDRPVEADEGIRVSDIVGELSLGEYRSNILEIPKIILVLDTCYSGNFVSHDGVVLTDADGVQKLANIASGYPTPDKMVLLTATAPGGSNRAYELRGAGLSAFGFFFARALSEDWACADTTADGIMTIRELEAFLRNRLNAAHKAALIEGVMRPFKRTRDDSSFLAYDATKYATDGDRGSLVELTASSSTGQVTTVTLPDGTTQTCQPRCSAVVSRALEGNLVLNTRVGLDMNKTGVAIGPGGEILKFPPLPPPPPQSTDTVLFRDVVRRGGHQWNGVTVTVK